LRLQPGKADVLLFQAYTVVWLAIGFQSVMAQIVIKGVFGFV